MNFTKDLFGEIVSQAAYGAGYICGWTEVSLRGTAKGLRITADQLDKGADKMAGAKDSCNKLGEEKEVKGSVIKTEVVALQVGDKVISIR